MKIDKQNPIHWIILFVTTINILITLPIRLTWKPKKRVIIFYGHKFHSNLKYFFEYIQKNYSEEYTTYFITMDYSYYKTIKNEVPALFSINPIHMIKSSIATAFITDHGLHMFKIYQNLSNIKFIDLWHGIPFQGANEADYGHLHNHDLTFVTSNKLREIYIKKFGFQPEKVKVTGYARTDPLINHSFDITQLKNKYGIPDSYKYIVLLAPTWQQNDLGKSVLPFNTESDKFFGDLDKLGTELNTLFIFRTHLNTKEDFHFERYKNIKYLSLGDYPLTSEILYLSDLLISDWSSISFDYLVLKRPTIFLDIPCPFVKGYTFTPDYRFGEIVSNFPEMKEALTKYIKSPSSFKKKYSGKMSTIFMELYGNNADGKAANRYFIELEKLLYND